MSSPSHFQNRRMVVFAGPHKSASSSVQELFMIHASSQQLPMHHHPSLVNWTWPYNPRRHSYLPRKGFAPLVVEGVGYHKLIWETTMEVWRGNDTNLIWGTEELDRFGATPWSHRDGLSAIQQVLDLVKPSSFEVVLNYRRPRKDQWISMWKQLTRASNGQTNYSSFLCDPEEYLRMWEYLDCVVNPLGFTKVLLDKGWKVHLVDMAGVAAAGKDVGHVVACQVLGVPCTPDGWLPDVSHPIVQNAKSGNPGLSASTLQDLEWVLQQRDCTFQADFEKAITEKRLFVHEGETVWKDCNSRSLSEFANTTFLLDLLQSQVACGAAGSDAIGKLQQRLSRQPEFPPQASSKMVSKPLPGLQDGQRQADTTSIPGFASQVYVSLVLLLFVVFSLLRVVKWNALGMFQSRSRSRVIRR